MNKSKQKELKTIIVKYSLCFPMFAFFCVVIFFLFDKKSMIDSADGLWQQYTYFLNCGDLIRTFFKNIFTDHIFELPMWDRTIGMGSDPFISSVGVTNYLFDPLYFLSVFTPAKYSEYVFDLIVIIKLYLSGISFIIFAYGRNYKNISVLAGSIIYVFSSTMFTVFLEPNFSFAFFGFPLLIFCSDCAWRGKSGYLYVLALSYCIIRSYYFTYMMLILLVVYCFIRYIFEHEKSIGGFFRLAGKFIFLTFIGGIIGGGIMFPSIVNMSKLNRLTRDYNFSLFDLETIKNIFSYIFTGTSPGGDVLSGVSSFVAISAICLFVSKKKEPVLKCCMALCILSFAFPFIGSLFNGFNAPTYRYIFSFLFCVSYMATVTYDSLKEFKGRTWYISLGISVIYGAICFLFVDVYSAISAISLFFSTLSVGIINLLRLHSKRIRNILYISTIFVSCIIIGYTCFHLLLSPLMMDSGSVYESVFVKCGMPFRKEVDSSQYRTDTLNAEFAENVMNSSMAANISGYDFYHSNQNQLIEDYYSSLAVLGNPMGFSHTGFRGRCYAEILNACNYIVRPCEKKTCIKAPYSYEYLKSNGEYSLFKSTNDISLIYFYDNVIPLEKYMDLDPVTRETNLMYYMVVDEPITIEKNIIHDAVLVPYEFGECENVSVVDDSIIVQEGGGYITLYPDDIEHGQISIYLSGLRSSNSDYMYKNAIALMDQDKKPVVIDYSAQYSTYGAYYTGNDDIVFSFESINENIDSIYLIFLNEGEYDLDSIQIYSRPYEIMDQTLDAFYDHADMDNITYDFTGNHLDITASCDSDRYLFISVPYSEGWKVEIDGSPVDIIKANITFMAIPITKGTHNIEMTYKTPNLLLGWTISALGLLLFAGYLFYEKKNSTFITYTSSGNHSNNSQGT